MLNHFLRRQRFQVGLEPGCWFAREEAWRRQHPLVGLLTDAGSWIWTQRWDHEGRELCGRRNLWRLPISVSTVEEREICMRRLRQRIHIGGDWVPGDHERQTKILPNQTADSFKLSREVIELALGLDPLDPPLRPLWNNVHFLNGQCPLGENGHFATAHARVHYSSAVNSVVSTESLRGVWSIEGMRTWHSSRDRYSHADVCVTPKF